MSDVLLYAALKQQTEITQKSINFKDDAQLAFYTRPQVGGGGYSNFEFGTENACCPPIMRHWQRVLSPRICCCNELYTNRGFKVCSTVGNWRCGASCTFTVPAGVTRVQFQLWGPGGNTAQNCCCGGSPFGPSGAWAAFQMNTTPGCQYTICAGCALCCCSNQGGNLRACIGPSYINGYGICACAEGAQSDVGRWMMDIEARGFGDTSCGIPWSHSGGTDNSCAPNFCGSWSFCYDSGNECAYHQAAWSSRSWNDQCNVDQTVFCKKCYGINGMWPHMKVAPRGGDACMTGTCSVNTPVFGFEYCMMDNIQRGNACTCHGHCRQAVNGWLRIPGSGGFGSIVAGGCGANGGDHGRFGMACVTYIS